MGGAARSAVGVLTDLLSDDSEAVRREAARALGQLGPEADSAVPHLLRVYNRRRPAPSRYPPLPGQIGLSTGGEPLPGNAYLPPLEGLLMEDVDREDDRSAIASAIERINPKVAREARIP
jgi:HEAT repeat protein